MSFFTAKDGDDINCRWDECNDPKCMGFGKAHYHKTVIWSCLPQRTTLDAWLSREPSQAEAKVQTAPVEAAPYPRWTYKQKGLGRVVRHRVHTNWRTNPYEQTMAKERAKADHASKMKD